MNRLLPRRPGTPLLVMTLLACNTCLFAANPTGYFFPVNLPHSEWSEFAARGYTQPVTGIIYRGRPRPTCGMPLGGLDTGCIDVETNGMLGYMTIFNQLVNPRRIANVPFLAVAMNGDSCILATDGKGKRERPLFGETGLWPPFDYSPAYFDVGLKDEVRFAKSIDYWGHYPIVDMQYQTHLPVEISLRAFAPLIPGDTKTSMTPGVLFEIAITNPTDKQQTGTLAITLPGFQTNPEEPTGTVRKELTGRLNGVQVKTTSSSATSAEYVLASFDGLPTRQGGQLRNTHPDDWKSFKTLPAVTTTGSSLALDFNLPPGGSVTRKVVWSWHAPAWNATGGISSTGKQFTHMYARFHHDAVTVARSLAGDHQQLLDRVIAWQEAVYQAPEIPGWLADSLINNLHLIPETSIWGQGTGPLATFGEEHGLFALNECPRGCSQFECLPCSFYGNIPIVYFFPDAALSTLRGYKQYQFPDGRPPWIFGGVTASNTDNSAPYDIAGPDKGYQTVLNGACYVVMADRYWRTTGDDHFLSEFYDSIKRANDFSLNLRPKYGLSQIMAMPEPGTDKSHMGDTEWFEAPEPGWKGYATHAGAVRMAQVQIIKAMAEAMHDTAYVNQCDAWLKAGKKVLEEILWNKNYYRNFSDPENGTVSDLIFGYQLDGEWIVDMHGVPSVFPKKRIDATLETIRSANCALSQSGATNYANPDGTPARVGGYGTYGYFPPELMMLAMTYMYEGQKEFGVDLLYRCLENIHCQWGYTWDAPNIMRGDRDTGERIFGADYYQNMMLWFVPAALAGEDMSGPLKEKGLAREVLTAGQRQPSPRRKKTP